MLGNFVGREDPGHGCSQSKTWLKFQRDDFQAFDATGEYTEEIGERVPGAILIVAAKVEEEVPWYAGVLRGEERFKIPRHTGV